METRRIIVLALLLLTCVAGLLWWILSDAFASAEQRRETSDDIIQGHRSTRGQPVKLSRHRLARSSRARDRLLELSLPAGDARALFGGRVLLVLFGNNVCLRRPQPGSLHFRRSVLGREAADKLLLAAQALEKTQNPGDFQISIRLSASSSTSTISARAALALVQAPQPREQNWIPKSLRLQLARAPAGAGPTLPWPFRRFRPEGFLKARKVLTAPRSTLETFFAAWHPGLPLLTQDPKLRFKVTALDVLGSG